MLKLTIFMLLASIISAVFLQELSDSNNFDEQNIDYQLWKAQDPNKIKGKPCSRRRNTPLIEEQLPASSLLQYQTLPIKSQSLRNENINRDEMLNKLYKLSSTPSITSIPDENALEDVTTSEDCKNAKDCDPSENLKSDVKSRRFKDDDLELEKKSITAGIDQRTLELIKDCNTKVNRINEENTNKDFRRFLVDRTLKQNADQNNYPIESTSRMGGFDDDELDSVEEEGSRSIKDPSRGSDVTSIGRSNKVMLMKNPRICYACSSANNPTCMSPNGKTTVKYCSKNHASCVTKTFGEGATATLIRDCASSCNDSPIPGIEPKYKTCKVCHSDFCNSAYSINSYNLVYVLLITVVKITF